MKNRSKERKDAKLSLGTELPDGDSEVVDQDWLCLCPSPGPTAILYVFIFYLANSYKNRLDKHWASQELRYDDTLYRHRLAFMLYAYWYVKKLKSIGLKTQ